uniref:Protein FAM221A n=1 Tax=Sus scrofa TaxID=9823 RepID=A0A8D1MUV8_PIG
MERLTLPPGGAAAVDEYLEYRRIVGEDDGGKQFTPEEYEEYKRKVIPIRLLNRLFVSWRSPTGVDCKLVGPETLCFCTHRYKQHKTDFEVIPQRRPISLPCRVPGCLCRAYLYVPLSGAQPIRCRCKHLADQHSAAPGLICNACSKCSGFHSCFTCACGQPAHAHDTVVETKQERLAQGKPVGRDVPYAAMGGLTGFSSLAEGYLRLDDSGIGAPSVEVLDASVTATDHPFLRAFQASSNSPPETLRDGGTSSQVPSLRKPEEDDMAFFERRYQERVLLKSALALREKEMEKRRGRRVGNMHTRTSHILEMQLGPFNHQILASEFFSLTTK